MPDLTDAQIDRIVAALLEEDRLLDTLLRRLEPLIRNRSPRLVPLQDLAEERSVTRNTIYHWCERHSIPIRDKSGAPKAPGDQSRSYVDRTEFALKRKLPASLRSA
jgi:hypothetical protein